MSLLGLIAFAIPLISCLYAIGKGYFFYAFAFFTILLLGVTQIELLLASNAYNIIDLFVFNIDKPSLETARIIFIAINLIGLFLLVNTRPPKEKNKDGSLLLIMNFKGIVLISMSISISALSLAMSLDTQDTGRPVFSGIGIALGLLLPFSVAHILLTVNYFHKLVGIFGLLTIFSFSRLLFFIGILTIIFYNFKLSSKRKPSIFKLSVLAFISSVVFLIAGQFKHLIGAGSGTTEAFFLSVDFFSWFLDTSFGGDRANLGLATMYTVGIELGAELTDCLLDSRIALGNLTYTLNDIFSSFFPGFIRQLFSFESQGAACNSAIVKSVLVDFIRSFGIVGVLFFSFSLWFYVKKCEIIALNVSNTFQLFVICLLGCFSIFLIRGAIGAFIAFGIASLVGLACVRICLNQNHLRSSPR